VSKIITWNNFFNIQLLTDVLLELKGKTKFITDLKEKGQKNEALKLIKEEI